jgi:acyl-CoA thioester hydrolase
MPRVNVELPASFSFQARIPVRITDLNFGGHVGNDRILSLIHEARVEYLASIGYKELDMAGVALIMADVAIEYKHELFYGDELLVSVAAADFTRVGFDLLYKLEKRSADGMTVVAKAKTGMVCYDYSSRKVVRIPPQAIEILSGH